MALRDDFIKYLPQEVSGARSGNRFDFQRDWALCHMLELHRTGDDYAIVFDFHDDVVTLDSATNPTKAHFYQIKTKKSGNWTTHALIRREDGENGPLFSIFGKLYGHRQKFSGDTGSLNFISNARFKVELREDPKSVDRESFALNAATDAELSKIKKAMKAELGTASEPDGEELVNLRVCSLSIDDHATHAQGHMAAFLSQEGYHALPPVPFYRTVFGEILRRNNSETVPTTFQELCRSKALSRSDFDSLLSTTHSESSIDDLVGEIRQALHAEGVPTTRSHVICQQCRLHAVQQTDKTNNILQGARAAIDSVLQGHIAAHGSLPAKLLDVVAIVRQSASAAMQLVCDNYSDTYLEAMIIVATYAQQELPPPSSEPSEEAP